MPIKWFGKLTENSYIKKLVKNTQIKYAVVTYLIMNVAYHYA